MRIAIVGGGFVGVATALFFAARGHAVTIVEADEKRRALLAAARAPFHEPGVDAALRRETRRGRLRVAPRLPAGAAIGAYVICVGTPTRGDGSADLSQVRGAAKDVGKHLRDPSGRPMVLVKSTVPPGTLDGLVVPILEAASRRRIGLGFYAGSNPEFLKEGSALRDTFHPDRVVVGAHGAAATRRIRTLYAGLRCPLVATEPTAAELIKYASNAFLATKVSFANEMANVAGALGVDAYEAMAAVGLDPRIGGSFLRAGAGFGGSCFPKDVRALASLARRAGRPSLLAEAVLQANERQPHVVVELAARALGGLRGRRVALLGLAFKPHTDDVRETRALPIYRALVRRGARVTVWDPKASSNFSRLLARPPRTEPTLRGALQGADAAILQTEWPALRRLRPAHVKRWMRRPLLIDGRRAVDGAAFEQAGVAYYAVGWPREPPTGRASARTARGRRRPAASSPRGTRGSRRRPSKRG